MEDQFFICTKMGTPLAADRPLANRHLCDVLVTCFSLQNWPPSITATVQIDGAAKTVQACRGERIICACVSGTSSATPLCRAFVSVLEHRFQAQLEQLDTTERSLREGDRYNFQQVVGLEDDPVQIINRAVPEVLIRGIHACKRALEQLFENVLRSGWLIQAHPTTSEPVAFTDASSHEDAIVFPLLPGVAETTILVGRGSHPHNSLFPLAHGGESNLHPLHGDLLECRHILSTA
jgi:hypothetical protein